MLSRCFTNKQGGGLRDKILVGFAFCRGELANACGIRTDANHVLYPLVIQHNIAVEDQDVQ